MLGDKAGKSIVEKINLKQLRIISNNFTQEIQDAQDGKKTSLAFIVHELSSSPIVKDGEIFESIVIGGTIIKIATLKRNGNTVQILDKKEEPALCKSREEFLDLINVNLPDDVITVALNFAHALKPVFENGILDGVLLEVNKEGKYHDLLGKQIGQEIENYVLAKKNKKIKVAVANDTVCLLMSGLSQFNEDKLAAGIVGTGINFAIFLSKNKLVNLQAGNFDKFPQTKTGIIVDSESSQPGAYLFQKETAGAYLHQHFNLVLKENDIDYPTITSTEELDKISQENIPQISEIAQNLLSRSAQMVACQIAGISMFKKHNMIFVMEGSLFCKGNNYRKTVEETVNQLFPEYKVNFVEIANSGILGAAKLVI